jgi:hypothetical protein
MGTKDWHSPFRSWDDISSLHVVVRPPPNCCWNEPFLTHDHLLCNGLGPVGTRRLSSSSAHGGAAACPAPAPFASSSRLMHRASAASKLTASAPPRPVATARCPGREAGVDGGGNPSPLCRAWPCARLDDGDIDILASTMWTARWRSRTMARHSAVAGRRLMSTARAPDPGDGLVWVLAGAAEFVGRARRLAETAAEQMGGSWKRRGGRASSGF